MNGLQFLGSIEIGLIYALVALGVYITFRIIDFPDLTVDGSFTTGAAVAAAMIISGYNSIFATIMAMLAGSIAGLITGYLNVRWNIIGLLAGIITMTALYSVNLRIMEKPNIAIMNDVTVFNYGSVVIVTLIIVGCLTIILARFFASKLGLAILASGINPRVSKAYGINVNHMKLIALAMSNGLIALSGALFAESQGFADVSMGSGTIIAGLASVIVGEAIMLQPKKIYLCLFACIIGSIIYRIVIAFALNAIDLGLEASDLNLITAIIVAITMILSKLRQVNNC